VQPTPPSPEPAPRTEPSLPLGFWIAGGTTVVATGVGSVFGILSLGSYADAEDQCPGHEDCEDGAMEAEDRALLQANVANVAFGTALVAALVTGYLYFTHDSTPAEMRASRPGTFRW
jgi:hypothetical protein